MCACRCSIRMRCRSDGHPRLVTACAVGLGRRFSASRLARRRTPLRGDLLQLHGQTARVPPGPTRARRRRRQHAARRVRQRGISRGRRRIRAPLRRRGDRRLRRDRGRGRGEPRRGHAGRRARARAAARSGRGRRRQGEARPPFSTTAGRVRQRRGVCGRDREHAGRRALRGVLQQRRRDRQDDALRLVLVG